MCCLLCYATAYGDGEVLLERIGGLVILGLFEGRSRCGGFVVDRVEVQEPVLAWGEREVHPDSTRPAGFTCEGQSWKGGGGAALDV